MVVRLPNLVPDSWLNPDLMLSTHDEEGHYLLAESTEVIGWPKENLAGTSAYNLFHDADIPTIAAHHQASIEGRWPRSWVRYRIRSHAGDLRWVESQTRKVESPDGTLLVVVTRRCQTQPEACIVDPQGERLDGSAG